jgi:2-dehydro-3-deoxyphosphooctonate aldolase (KDO 8-P synthase)
MKEIGFPVVFDCTHSVQKPGASGGTSGGDPRFILPLAKAAVAVGVDALFIETHPNPPEALSDKQCQVPTSDLDEMISRILSEPRK